MSKYYDKYYDVTFTMQHPLANVTAGLLSRQGLVETAKRMHILLM